jgi:hypothetical protein
VSVPMVSTDRTREAQCTSCAQTVTERLHRGAWTDDIRWIKERHNGVCGLPCLAAGVDGKIYKTGNFHRGFQACPSCCPGTSGRKETTS